MTRGTTSRPAEPGWYEVRLHGRLDPRWSTWLDGVSITSDTDGTTVLTGRVADQAALHGLLARVRDIGLPLISVTRVDHDRALQHTHHQDPTGD
jgi:hypothetical protein